jgi:hypothetical protein
MIMHHSLVVNRLSGSSTTENRLIHAGWSVLETLRIDPPELPVIGDSIAAFPCGIEPQPAADNKCLASGTDVPADPAEMDAIRPPRQGDWCSSR